MLRNPVPSIYSGMTPVAINAPQYDDSTSCGMCVEVTGTGEGSGGTPITGTFKGYVSDQCPECKPGDLDLATSGDGRWKLSWKAIPCEDGKVSFYFEGSNDFFLKMQPRNIGSPATSVKVGGVVGSRTQDNFYEFQNGGAFKFPVDVEVETVLGCVYSGKIGGYTGDNAISGLSTKGCGSVTTRSDPDTQIPVEEKPKDPVVKPRSASGGGGGGGCAGKYGQCGGTGFKGSPCCKASKCRKVNEWYSQCI